MKLHRLVVENLASLEGRTELDFDATLGGAAIFLVRGPTGAGKSTLLDAISLALFGVTPRLPKAADSKKNPELSAHNVVTRGSLRGGATLEFSKLTESGRKWYRAGWVCSFQ